MKTSLQRGVPDRMRGPLRRTFRTGGPLSRVGPTKARRGVAHIVLGTAVGQGLLVAVSPILSRLYDPADFAVLQVFTGVVSVAAVLVTMRLELAVPLAADDRQARAVLQTGLAATVAGSVLLGVLGFLTADLWARDQTLGALRTTFWVVPPTVAAVAAFQLVSQWLVREERYRDLAVRSGVQGAMAAGAQVGLGALGARPVGLLVGMGLGRAAGLVSVARRPRPAGARVGWASRAEMLAALRRFRRFPLVTSQSAVLNNLGQYAPFVVFSLTYGAVATGLLAFTSRLLAVPVVLVGQAVAQVYLGRGAAMVRGDRTRLPGLTWLATRRLVLVGVVPTALVIVAGPDAFGLVFGAEWTRAGEFARVLAPAFLAQFATAPVTHVFALLERQGLGLGWDAARLALVVAAPLAAWSLGASDLVAGAAYGGALLLGYLGVLLLARRVLRNA